MGRKKKPLCSNCSELANRIAEAILNKFSLKFAAVNQNYWGLSSLIPKMLAELIDQILEEENERTEEESR